MNLESVVTWSALVISVISLLVSGYAIYRDRSRVKVFCKVIYDCSKDQSENLDNPPPFLRIYAVNTGKRAIFLSDLCGYISRKSSSSWALKDEPIVFDEHGLPSVVSSGFVHDVAVRLDDGDIYEYRIKHDDYTKLYAVNHDGLLFKKYFLTDVLGKKYPVKGSKKGIEKLLKYKA
ncbi:hypothetical protein ACLIOB_003496 [Vibrio cholerae]|uniref:hypothetical protein n=1 Tax=Vibrio cholerae TaxID=666 RepID=UPI0018F0FEFA|nr:hypothetical protein [Vibrio cholerae]MBJ6973430.1 hypothetical protein [Vibrio cholerae]HDB1440503.1 hypothetical protein [Vibrio cholerae]HDB1451194.1 hypothetical protein [Vibrio cholerae]